MRWLLLTLTLSLFSCGSCGDDSAGDRPPHSLPDPGAGEVLAYELGEVDMASASQNGALPRFEDPIPPDESRAMADSFDWSDTEALSETDPDGRPSLYYVMLYLESRDQIHDLETGGLAWEMLPMFGEERARWAGQTGVFTFTGDGRGVFAFAVLPGAIYNSIRQLALEDDAPFRAVILRDPPSDTATNEDGSLDYDYLAGHGFEYPAPTMTPAMPNALVTASYLRAHAQLAVDAVDELRRAAERTAAFFGGEAHFLLELDVRNTDPDFYRADYDPPMYSGWRRTAEGERTKMVPRGAKLRLQTDLLLRDTPIRGDGRVRLKAFKGTSYSVCIEAKNDAGIISEFLTPIIACHIGEGAGEDSPGAVPEVEAEDFYQRIVIRDYVINMLTQFTDSRDYMREVMGRDMRAIRVLVGPLADSFGAGASTICNGDDSLDVGNALIDLSMIVPPVQIALSNDSLFRAVGEFGDADRLSAITRLVPTHEYGHFVFCEVLKSIEYHAFGGIWSGLLAEAIGPGKVAGSTGQETSEALADFFSWQVVGGVNYFNFHRDWGREGWGSYYCDPLRDTPDRLEETGRSRDEARNACVEDNLGGPDPIDADADISDDQFKVNLARTVTIMHDAFDGAPTYDGERAEIPARQDGSWWWDDGVYRWEWTGGASSTDEDVALPPHAYNEIFDEFVWAPNTILTDHGWYDAVARVLRRYGHSAAEVCAMFALHAPEGDCRALVSDAALGAEDSVPFPPYDLRFSLNTANDAVWSWEDGATFSTGYSWTLAGDDGDRREDTPSLPFATEDALSPDAQYTFTVRTLNNDQRSEPVQQSFVTYAAPTTVESGTGEPGGALIGWADVGATSYTVEVEEPSGLRFIAGRTDETSFRVTGLEGNILHRFRVFSENREGARSEPSPWYGVITQPVTTIYVAPPPAGDDANTGVAGDPVATLGQALMLADSRNAQAIEFAAGTYTETGAVSIDRTMTLSGSGSGATEIRVTGLQNGARCGAGDVNTQSFPSTSAVVAPPGVQLNLRGLTLHAAPAAPPDETCITALDFAGFRLRVIDAEVGVDTTASTDCAIGIVARDAESVSVERSFVVGLSDGSVAGVDHELAGLCTEAVASVRIADSTVSAAGSFPMFRVLTMHGAAIDRADDVDVARSFILANGDQADANAFDATAVAGLYVSATNRVFVHNSSVMTARGAATNRAIDVEAPFGSAVDVFLFHVTANVGDDWGDVSAAPTEHRGSAVRIAGDLARLEMVNSVLSHAGGYGSGGWGAALNIADLDEPLDDFFINGNAFSVADRPFAEGKSALVIVSFDPEFGFLTRAVNSATSYTNAPCQSTSPPCAGGNLELYSRPADATDIDSHIAAVALDGKPTPLTFGGNDYTVTFDSIVGGGVPLSAYSRGTLVAEDLDGGSRPLDEPTGIGPFDLAN